MKKPCVKDIDNDFIINNAEKFKIIHQKKGIKLIEWESHINDLVIIPVTINVYLDSNKLKINLYFFSSSQTTLLLHRRIFRSFAPTFWHCGPRSTCQCPARTTAGT